MALKEKKKWKPWFLLLLLFLMGWAGYNTLISGLLMLFISESQGGWLADGLIVLSFAFYFLEFAGYILTFFHKSKTAYPLLLSGAVLAFVYLAITLYQIYSVSLSNPAAQFNGWGAVFNLLLVVLLEGFLPAFCAWMITKKRSWVDFVYKAPKQNKKAGNTAG